MAEAAIDHVLGGQAGDRRVIGVDLRQAGVSNLIVQVDRRDLGPEQFTDTRRSRGAGDDAVAIPPLHPGRHTILERTLLDIDGPRSVLAHILRDAAEDRPAKRRRCLDDQGDVGQWWAYPMISIHAIELFVEENRDRVKVVLFPSTGVAESCRRSFVRTPFNAARYPSGDER